MAKARNHKGLRAARLRGYAEARLWLRENPDVADQMRREFKQDLYAGMNRAFIEAYVKPSGAGKCTRSAVDNSS